MKTTGNPDMNEEMTEAEEAAFDAAAADPSLITTAEQGREIIDGLGEDIDAIKEQLEAAKLEAEVCGLTDDRQAWVRRATSALVWKKRQQKAVRDRLREIDAEWDAAAKVRHIQAHNDRSISQATMFVAAARVTYSKEEHIQLWARAREMFPDSPAWLPLSADGAAT